MTFGEATDRLLSAGISLSEIAEALGVSYPAVKQARLDRDRAGFRPPPSSWRSPLARLAGERGAELSGLPDVILLFDEFEFEDKGRRFRCRPSGDAVASIAIEGRQARVSESTWHIDVDGAFLGTVKGDPDETEQTIGELAKKLAEELED